MSRGIDRHRSIGRNELLFIVFGLASDAGFGLSQLFFGVIQLLAKVRRPLHGCIDAVIAGVGSL